PPKEEFRYDVASDTSLCPAGKTSRPKGSKRGSSEGRRDDGMRVHYPSRHGCRPCPLKETCAPTGIRMIHRSPREEVRERAKSREGTPDFQRSKTLRMRVERLFADIKHNDGFRRVRLRGRRGADEQFVLAATARNLKWMITLLGNAGRAEGRVA
ncbi:MAG: transposase, partial [Pseudomonadota bacterium]